MKAALRRPSTAVAERLGRALLAWYRVHKRELPWRGSDDPYAIWVSEVMLQQTQASVVGPYYSRFLARFPDAATLADAPLPDVLGHWSGLGYYARARTLHAAAKLIADQGFPRTLEGLRELPGFGPYTAAAVGSIAFGLAEPAIDGNAVRVYARLFGLRAPRAAAEPQLREATRELIRAGPPGDLNQALMDLGQLVCTVKAPRCMLCPWRTECRAHREGATDEIPVRTKARPRKRLDEKAVLMRRGTRILLARRRESGLFGGLWELPGGGAADAAELAALLARELGVDVIVGEPLGTIEQTLTHRDLTLTAHQAKSRREPHPPGDGRYLEARYVNRDELARLGLSTATRRLLAALGIPALKGDEEARPAC